MKVEIKKNTDQLNYEDFLGGITRLVTIKAVERGRKEAQYDIAIEGDDRYWRPPATVLKQLVLAYGDNAQDWVGQSAMLYGDPDVKMAGKKVGGIRVSHLSHIEKPLTASLSVTRGQTGVFTIDPLPANVLPPTESAIACATDKDQLREWHRQFPTLRESILARVAEIDATEGGGR
jgi:hypothetical protein